MCHSLLRLQSFARQVSPSYGVKQKREKGLTCWPTSLRNDLFDSDTSRSATSRRSDYSHARRRERGSEARRRKSNIVLVWLQPVLKERLRCYASCPWTCQYYRKQVSGSVEPIDWMVSCFQCSHLVTRLSHGCVLQVSQDCLVDFHFLECSLLTFLGRLGYALVLHLDRKGSFVVRPSKVIFDALSMLPFLLIHGLLARCAAHAVVQTVGRVIVVQRYTSFTTQTPCFVYVHSIFAGEAGEFMTSWLSSPQGEETTAASQGGETNTCDVVARYLCMVRSIAALLTASNCGQRIAR